MKKCVANHTDDYLASRGLWRKPIANDGSSLFRAVAEQVFNTQAQHLKVREALINCLKGSKDNYRVMLHDLDGRIQKLKNPRESGGQFEIIVLSPMYKMDFIIISENDQDRNVTQNGYKRKVLLCFSNSNHFDIIYPHSYTVSAAICQSIVYGLLYEKVFKLKDALTEANHMINTKPERPWSHKAAETADEAQNLLNRNGIVEKRSPFPFKVAKALSPDIYRNVEYESWKDAKNETHHRDFYPLKDFFPGDKCQVKLSGNLYNAHIQDMSPDKGPVSVFIEELGEKQTVSHSSLIKQPFSGCKEKKYSSLEENFDTKLKLSKLKKKDQLGPLTMPGSGGLSPRIVDSPGLQTPNSVRMRPMLNFRGFCGRIGEYRQQINAAGHPVRKWNFREGYSYRPRFPGPLKQKLLPQSGPPQQDPQNQPQTCQVQGVDDVTVVSSSVSSTSQDLSQIQPVEHPLHLQASLPVTLSQQPPTGLLQPPDPSCIPPPPPVVTTTLQYPAPSDLYEDPALQLQSGYLPVYQDGGGHFQPQQQSVVMMMPVGTVDSSIAPIGNVDARYFFNLGVEYYKMSHGPSNQVEDAMMSNNGQFTVAKISPTTNTLVKNTQLVKPDMRSATQTVQHHHNHVEITDSLQKLHLNDIYKDSNSNSPSRSNMDLQKANTAAGTMGKTNGGAPSLIKEPLSVCSQDSGCGDSDISSSEGLDGETTFDDSLDSLGCQSDSISPHSSQEAFRGENDCSPGKQFLAQTPMRPIPTRFRTILDDEAKKNPAQFPKRFEGQPLIRHKPLGNRKRKLARLAQMAQMLEHARERRFEFNPNAESFTPINSGVNNFQPRQNGLFVITGHSNTHMMAVPVNASSSQISVPLTQVDGKGHMSPQQGCPPPCVEAKNNSAADNTTACDTKNEPRAADHHDCSDLEDSVIKPDPAIIHIVRSSTTNTLAKTESRPAKITNIVKDVSGQVPSNVGNTNGHSIAISSASSSHAVANCVESQLYTPSQNDNQSPYAVFPPPGASQHGIHGGITVNGTVYYINHQGSGINPPAIPSSSFHNSNSSNSANALPFVPPTNPMLYPQQPPPPNPCVNNVVFVHPPPTGGANSGAGQMPVCGPPPMFVPQQIPSMPQQQQLLPPPLPPSQQPPPIMGPPQQPPTAVQQHPQAVLPQQPPPPSQGTAGPPPPPPPPQGTVYYGPVYQPLQQPCHVQYAPAVSGAMYNPPQYS